MDNVTSVLASINKSIDSTVSAFEKMDGSTGASFIGARASIARTKSQLESLTQAMEKTTEPIKKQSSLWDGIKGKVSAAVGAYAGFQSLKSAISLSDTISQNTARLNMMNDGMQSTKELSDMIYASAQRSRGSYLDTADAVAKLGTMAGDAFSSNKEIIAFSEQLNKHFTLAGTSIEGQQAAMLQLTQAMGSGALRGEELNSVLEQAPNIVETIAKYMNKPKGAIKDLAAEGQITAEIVKEAMLASADETNKKFNSMPKTFGQTWQEIKSSAAKAFEGISGQLSEVLNGAQVKDFVSGIVAALPTAFSALSTLLGYIRKIGGFIADNWSVIAPILAGIVSGFVAFKAVTSAADAIKKVGDSIEIFKNAAGFLKGGGLKGIFKAFSLGPVGAIIVGLTALVGAIVLLWNNCEGFRDGVKRVWSVVKNAFITAWTAITDFFTKTIPNAFNAVLDFFKSIPGFFQNLWNTVKDAFASAWTAITDFFTVTVPAAFQTVLDFFKGIPGFFTGLWKKVSGAFTAGWNAIASNPVVAQIVDTVKALWNNAKNALLGIWNGIKTAASGAWKLIKNVVLGPILLLCDLVTGNFGKLKEDAAMIWKNIKAAAGAIWNGIKTQVLSYIRGIVGAARAAWTGFSNNVRAIFNGVKQFFVRIWNAIKNFVINTVTGIKNKAVNGFRNMVEGIKQRVSKIKETVVKGFNGAIEFIKSLPERALQWGRDFIDGLKQGIKEKITSIGDAVKDVADKIRALLHFSRPDTGPLREYEKWMPDFMKGLSAGISQNKSLVVNQVKDLASRMQAVKLGATYNMNGGRGMVRPLPASAVRTAQSTIATTNNQNTKNVYLNVTIEKEADENRFMRKLKEILEEGAYAGAEGVY